MLLNSNKNIYYFTAFQLYLQDATGNLVNPYYVVYIMYAYTLLCMTSGPNINGLPHTRHFPDGPIRKHLFLFFLQKAYIPSPRIQKVIYTAITSTALAKHRR